jgi:hypothetical protein
MLSQLYILLEAAFACIYVDFMCLWLFGLSVGKTQKVVKKSCCCCSISGVDDRTVLALVKIPNELWHLTAD